jgi:hypothetical protein
VVQKVSEKGQGALRALTNFVVFLISTAIFFLAAEVAVRVFLPQRVESPSNFFMRDPVFGWRCKPDIDIRFESPDFNTRITTNNRGFRDIAHDYDKKAGTYRIVGIGDSFLFGWGVEKEETVLSLLPSILGPEATGKELETVNLGIPGHNITQYREMLESEAPKYSPDMVILFFYMNDWKEGSGYDFKGIRSDGEQLTINNEFSLKSIRSALLPIRVFMKRHSQLYILIRDRLNIVLKKKRLMAIPEIEDFRINPNFSDKYRYTFDTILGMRSFCADKLHCKFIVCLIPEAVQVRQSLREIVCKAYGISAGDYDWLQPQKAMSKFCAGNGIYLFDLTEDIARAEKSTACYFTSVDVHWNRTGHALAADRISAFIKKNGMVR